MLSIRHYDNQGSRNVVGVLFFWGGDSLVFEHYWHILF